MVCPVTLPGVVVRVPPLYDHTKLPLCVSWVPGSSKAAVRIASPVTGFSWEMDTEVTVGPTLFTDTDLESDPMLFDGSWSFAVTDTVEVAGPSGKVQSKLFAAGVSVLVPAEPQSSTPVVAAASSPASVTV